MQKKRPHLARASYRSSRLNGFSTVFCGLEKKINQQKGRANKLSSQAQIKGVAGCNLLWGYTQQIRKLCKENTKQDMEIPCPAWFACFKYEKDKAAVNVNLPDDLEN